MKNPFYSHKNIITCDSCNEDIKLMLHTRRIEDDVYVTYFACNHCDEEYFCYATNDESRKIQREIQKERNFIKKQKLQKEHQIIVARLNEKYKPQRV